MLRAGAAADFRSGSQCSGNVHIIAPVERSIAPTGAGGVLEESVAVAARPALVAAAAPATSVCITSCWLTAYGSLPKTNAELGSLAQIGREGSEHNPNFYATI